MLRVGLVGIGFMGWIHYLAYRRTSMAKLVAICTRDHAKRAGDWTTIKGNFGPPGEKVDLSDIAVFESLDIMLKDPGIDLVDICLPPHLHAEAVCKSLRAGKHVLCEKPLGLNTTECDTMLAAAKDAGRRILVAQVLPFMGEFQYAYEAAKNGNLGKIKNGYFKRTISPPDWIPDFYDPQKVGGPLIDLHVHDTHFVRMLFGMPKRVICIGEMKEGVVKFCSSLMDFTDPNLSVATTSGVGDQSARPFCHGYEIQFEKATLQFELAACVDGVDTMPLKVLGIDGKVDRPILASADEVTAFTNEIEEAVLAIESNTPAPRLDGQLARDAIHICQCLEESAKTRNWVSTS